jgi:hypothetical protein
MLGWDRYGFKKKPTRTSYAEHVSLCPVGSMGHIVHSGVTEARNVTALFFMMGWDWYGFNKKRTGIPYAEHVFLHPVGYVGRVVHSGASGAQNVDAFSSPGGPGAVSIKNAPGHVTHNLCFCILCDVGVS